MTLLILLAGCPAPGPLEEGDRWLPSPPGGQDDGSDRIDQIDLVGPTVASGEVRVHVLDVGQGDATVWQLPGDGIVLYDCGASASTADQDPVTRFLEDEIGLVPGDRIDLLIVSHGHLDHVRECEEVLEAYDVDQIVDLWYTGDDRTQAYRAFQAAVLAEGAGLWTVEEVPEISDDRRLAAGDRLPLPAAAREAGLVAQVLWPPGPMVEAWDGIAEASVTVRLTHGTVDLCFQGDISTVQEAAILALAPGLGCEGYLVGHHGSAHASSQTWLAQLAPEAAVASFGDNPYGHPAPEALCRIQSADARLYTTHRLGTVTLTSDGGDLNVTPDRPEPRGYCQPGASYWDQAPAQRSGGRPPIDGELTVEARPDRPEPCRYTDVTVHVHVTDGQENGVANATVETTWRFKTSSPQETAVTDADGRANLTRYISGASAGYTVEVEVRAWTGDHGGQTAASFTPQDC